MINKKTKICNIFRKVTFLNVLLLLPTQAYCDTKSTIETTPQNQTLPPLTGKEILVTYRERGGQTKTAALSLDTKNLRVSKPQFVFRGARKVSWTPSYKHLSFLRGDYIWYGDLEGNEIPFSPIPLGAEDSSRPPLSWDWQGQAYTFQTLANFGSSLLRSNILDEKMPVKKVTTQPAAAVAFVENITPLAGVVPNFPSTPKPSAYNIDNVSFAPNGESFVAQVSPAFPYGWGQSQSQIYEFKILDKYPLKYEAMIKDKEAILDKFYISSGGIPLIDGNAQALWPQSEQFADITPLFSPSGKFMAFNRINKQAKTVIPMIYDVGQKKVLPVQVGEFSSTQQIGEGNWGRPQIDILQWNTSPTGTPESLWVMSTARDGIFQVVLEKGDWKLKETISYDASDGAAIQYVTVRNGFVVWTGNRSEAGRVHFYNIASKTEQIYDLPAGSVVEWIS